MSHIRPKRTKEETCQHCRRPGWKHDVPYALLTSAEYLKVMGEDLVVKRLPASYEPMYAGCGSTIHAAVKEALDYVDKYSRIAGVGFIFNDELVLVTAYDDADKLVRRWWKAVYKETPEESFAKR